MRRWHLLLVVGLSFPCATGSARTTSTSPIPAARQLLGLDAGEATAVVAKLADAQRRLKAGEFQSFELLAGSIASYGMTKVSPRDVFLEVSFERAWKIERVRTDNRLWQPYRLAYAPHGGGQLYCDIEAVLGSNGNIERVTIIYKPPAPF